MRFRPSFPAPAAAIAATAAVVVASLAPVAAQAPRRPLQVADLDAYRDIRDLTIAPDGAWVAYTVVFPDTKKDKDDADVWMTNWAGTEHVRLTASPERESQPRFSPDGKWLAFVSSRSQGDDDKPSGGQVWLMSRQGGEARRLTERKGGVSDFQWSPDSSTLVLAGDDPDPEEDKDKGDDDKPTKKPIVVDRYHFKADAGGYLDHRRSHLYLLTIATGAIQTLTSGDFDDQLPAWSPDGSKIAFTSGRGGDHDKTNDSNVCVIDAKPGAEARVLTTWAGPDDAARPAWSPDGASIAYLQGSEPKLFAYSRNTLAVVPAAGGAPKLLTDPQTTDVDSPLWAPDGKAIYVQLTDDRARELARVPVTGGPLVKLTSGRRVVKAAAVGQDGRVAVLATTGTTAPEIHALEAPAARPDAARELKVLTHQNDAWLAGIQLGAVEDVDSTSADGTKVGSVLVKPPSFAAGTRYPLILFIHGGPNSQDQHELDLESQILAAKGYVVLNVNYRGSAGRDAAYQTAIYADWGHKEVVDLRGAVDHLIATGVVDPARLGIGGWSYGGILTDYTIATDPRFKAAVSGAGSALQTSMYGTDQYVLQYNLEMGPPWKNPEVWTKVSYPFLHADRIKTPTLFMCSQADFNVPCAGAEQMYQALRTEGVDTQLVIYPGQHHGLTIPSYRRDRLQRYLDWYAKYLGGVK